MYLTKSKLCRNFESSIPPMRPNPRAGSRLNRYRATFCPIYWGVCPMPNSYHTVLKPQLIASGNRIQEVSMSRKEDMDNRANQMNPNNDAY